MDEDGVIKKLKTNVIFSFCQKEATVHEAKLTTVCLQIAEDSARYQKG